MERLIESYFDDSIAAKRRARALSADIAAGARLIIDALRQGRKLLVCGNGGSAADAQHFVAELAVRFERDRPGLPAIALAANTSTLTAGANDFGYDSVFARQVESLGEEGDVLVGITTSGNSPNVLAAFTAAKRKGLRTVCLNGKDGGAALGLSLDANIVAPSARTSHVQEIHIAVIHVWSALIDEAFAEAA